MIQHKVIDAFQHELEESKLPGYVSRYDDFDHEDAVAETAEPVQRRPASAPPRRDTPRPSESRSPDTQMQPPQRPHGPHKAPIHQTTRPQGEFGAGIF